VREPFDLRCLRHALDGAEPVHRATLDAVEARFGVRVSPVYGLAENTLGVAFGRPGEPDLLDGGRRVVSVGAPLPGTDLAVDDRGEILVRGPATMRGYLHDPEGTDGALADGWLHTGDLGRIDGGRLYVTGREKDLVIQYGRKFHPYEVERFAAEAAGSPPNGAAAFSLDATAEVVVVVETRREGAAGAVRGVLLERLGVRPDRVVCVAPGELPRTTSGKVRRAEAAARFGAAS
jgi:acyl-CoA synthetase (AMP-forming)/AMP-acid ligase II